MAMAWHGMCYMWAFESIVQSLVSVCFFAPMPAFIFMALLYIISQFSFFSNIISICFSLILAPSNLWNLVFMCGAYTAHSSLYDFFNSFSIYVYFGWMQLWIVRRLVMLWQIVHLCFWDFQFDSLFFSYVFFCLVLCSRCKRCSVKCAVLSFSPCVCMYRWVFFWINAYPKLSSHCVFTITHAFYYFECFIWFLLFPAPIFRCNDVMLQFEFSSANLMERANVQKSAN